MPLSHDSGMRFFGFRLSSNLAAVTEAQLWAHLDEDWTAFFRVAIAPGLPVVEMRVFPAGSERDAVEWDGDPESVGRFSLPARKVRGIRLSEVQQHVIDAVEHGPDDEFFRQYFADPVASMADEPRKIDPEWTTQQRLAMVARDYVELVDGGEPYPNQRLAEAWGRTPSQITTDIYNARHRYQLLTQAPGRGEAGGRLTKKAEGILRRMDDTEGEPE